MTENINTQYEDLLRRVIEEGTHKEDRTGTGTTSLFGPQLRYDLSDGFPLLTTKKVFMRGLSEELFWFLRGSTNSHELEDIKVNIWKEWAAENGDLGPVYGYVWRYAPTNIYTKPVEISIRHDVHADYQKNTTEVPHLMGVGYDGGDVSDVEHAVKQLWTDLIYGCYDPDDIMWDDLGGKGYSVSPFWHSLRNFADTLHQVPLYPIWKENQATGNYVLDASYFGSNVLSPTTAIFLPEEAYNLINEAGTAYKQKGDKKLYLNKNVMNSVLFKQSVESDDKEALVAYVESKSEEVQPSEGKLYRPQVYIDQVEWLVNEIQNNPDSRRLILTAWNPSLVDYQALPPCHTLAQFYVADGKLSCQLYQRSGDLFLGIPFNIASYALLTHMLAQQTGLEVGEFVHTIGDAHVYDNHHEQVAEQLSREARPFPTLKLNKAPSIDEYQFSDVEIEGYDPHPSIKAPVAV